MVDKLVVYTDQSRGVYRGIHREFYPRWLGWKLIEEGRSLAEIDGAVVEFYMTYFFYRFKLDLVNVEAQFLLFNFGTSEGGKKMLSKLQKVTNSRLEGTELLEAFNTMGPVGLLQLKLELLEFYYYVGRPIDGAWVLSC